MSDRTKRRENHEDTCRCRTITSLIIDPHDPGIPRSIKEEARCTKKARYKLEKKDNNTMMGNPSLLEAAHENAQRHNFVTV
jgi:hypothetical protein